MSDLHTQAPWEVDDNEGFSINRIYANGKLIAEVVGDSAEANANARLIAVSPELLAFVKDVKRVAHDGLLPPEWEKVAKQLIAKAKGRS